MGAMDELIDASSVRHLGRLMQQHGVEPKELVAAADSLADHKLRQRVDIARDALLGDLPDGYDAMASVVRAAFNNETFRGYSPDR
jgi:hypothetical protein